MSSTETTPIETKKQVGTRDKDVPWYYDEVKNVPAKVRTLLKEWSGVAPEDVEAHILQIVR